MTEEIMENTAPEAGDDNTSENESQLSDDVLNELDENIQKEIKSLRAQKEHFRGKFEKTNTAFEELQGKVGSLTEKEEAQPEQKESTTTDAEWRERVEFMAANAGKFDTNDLEKLSSIAKIEGKKLSEAAESDLYKGYLKIKEEQAQSANTTPSAGSESPTVGKFDSFENVKPEDIETMDSETFKKFQKYMASKNPNQR